MMHGPICQVCSRPGAPKPAGVEVIANTRDRYDETGFTGVDRLGYHVVFRCHGDEERRYFTAAEWSAGKQREIDSVFAARAEAP